jgi:hypothetical protein
MKNKNKNDDKHIDILITLADINHRDKTGKPTDIVPLPGKKDLRDGYEYHKDIGIHHFNFHIRGDQSCKGVIIEEIDIEELK